MFKKKYSKKKPDVTKCTNQLNCILRYKKHYVHIATVNI